MKTRNLLLLFITVVMIFQITACGRIDEKIIVDEKTYPAEDIKSFPLTLKDSFEREVILEQEPKRVVSVAPNITETIFALGKQDKLVGRTEFCDYPPESADIELIGSLQQPNIEKILELKPDLVIASTHFKKETLAKLEEANVVVAVLYGEESFDGVYDIIKKIGMILNADMEADTLIKEMKDKVAMVEDKVRDLDKPNVYYVVGYGKYGDYTAGGDTFVAKIIEMAGGKNAAEDLEGWKYNIESLIEKNPEIMICSKYFDSKVGIENTNGYNTLKAVKERKLYEIDNNMLDRQGPRLSDGLYELAKIIHPDVFEEF